MDDVLHNTINNVNNCNNYIQLKNNTHTTKIKDIIYQNEKGNVVILLSNDNKYIYKLKSTITIINEINIYKYMKNNNLNGIIPNYIGNMKDIEYGGRKYDYLIILERDPDYVSLNDFMKNRRLRLRDKYIITKNLLYGLAKLHSNNIIHRDIKPGNILINTNSLEIKFIDFDLSTLTNKGNVCDVICDKISGTHNFIDPLLMNRNNIYIDKWDLINGDLWSLCVTIYMLFAKKYPFNSKGKYKKIISKKSKSFYSIPEKVLYTGGDTRYTLNELIDYIQDISI